MCKTKPNYFVKKPQKNVFLLCKIIQHNKNYINLLSKTRKIKFKYYFIRSFNTLYEPKNGLYKNKVSHHTKYKHS